MHQANKITPPSEPTQPHLKLRRASVDQADAGPDAVPPVVIEEDSVRVVPGTVLPKRCVKCGDAMDTFPSRTLRGGISYRLCREHVVSTVACVLAGAALVILGMAVAWYRLVGDPIVGNSVMVLCVLLAGLGGYLVYRSLPTLTSGNTDGRHRIRRLHAAVVDDLRRSLP
jgi:hypothetical protein